MLYESYYFLVSFQRLERSELLRFKPTICPVARSEKRIEHAVLYVLFGKNKFGLVVMSVRYIG
jgi:hypothetical protein